MGNWVCEIWNPVETLGIISEGNEWYNEIKN